MTHLLIAKGTKVKVQPQEPESPDQFTNGRLTRDVHCSLADVRYLPRRDRYGWTREGYVGLRWGDSILWTKRVRRVA